MNWWQYLLLVNIYLLLFFGFYALLLRRETFFQLNRLYLVCAAILSFLIPLIQTDWIKNLFITQTVHYKIYGGPVIIYQLKPIAHVPFSIGQLLAALYIAGVILLVIRFAWQLVSLKRIIKQEQTDAPYAFFKKIKLGEQSHDNDIIAAHEQVHARQWHSADVLIIEAVMIINWFNPVVYLYRYAIKHIHEFIADSYALEVGTDKQEYAMLLLTQTFHTSQHQLVSNFFNRSLLKQRILMLQKSKSQRITLLKYGLSAPLFILMLILSSATVNNSKAVTRVNNIAGTVFALPANGSGLASIKIKLQAPEIAVNREIELSNKKISPTIKPETAKQKETQRPDSISKPDDLIFTAVEKEPTFPGDFGAYLGKSIRYPAIDRENAIQGRVFVTFVVETDGTLSNVKVLRTPDEHLGAEAARVIAESPKWNPGYQNGIPVRVQFTVPISFTLTAENEQLKADTSKSAVIVTGYVMNDTSKRLFRVSGNSFGTVNNLSITNNLINPLTGVEITNDKQTPLPREALVIIDGKEKTIDDMKLLDVSTIKSISVWRGDEAKAKFGSKGANGVIIITTKK